MPSIPITPTQLPEGHVAEKTCQLEQPLSSPLPCTEMIMREKRDLVNHQVTKSISPPVLFFLWQGFLKSAREKCAELSTGMKQTPELQEEPVEQNRKPPKLGWCLVKANSEKVPVPESVMSRSDHDKTEEILDRMNHVMSRWETTDTSTSCDRLALAQFF